MAFIMKDWHKLILVYLAGRKTYASPDNMKQYLKMNGISKSHTAITTACKESLSAVLFCHDQSLFNDDGTVKRKRFQYSLKDGVPPLRYIVESLNDPDSQHKFMESPYYRCLIPELVQRFNDMMPLHDIHASKSWAEDFKDSSVGKDSVVHLSDTYCIKEHSNNVLCCVVENHRDRPRVTFEVSGLSDEDMEVLKNYLIKHGLKLGDDDVFEDTTEKPLDHWTRVRYTTDPEAMDDKLILIVKNHLSDEDAQYLTMSLEDNWLALKFVLHFVSATHNERDRILDQVKSDANNPRLSPWAAWECGFGDALKRVEFMVCDAESLRPVYAKRKKERQSEPLNNWIDFFDQLSRLNSNYRFLFV